MKRKRRLENITPEKLAYQGSVTTRQSLHYKLFEIPATVGMHLGFYICDECLFGFRDKSNRICALWNGYNEHTEDQNVLTQQAEAQGYDLIVEKYEQVGELWPNQTWIYKKYRGRLGSGHRPYVIIFRLGKPRPLKALAALYIRRSRGWKKAILSFPEGELREVVQRIS